MPEGANPPAKPEGYGEQAQDYLRKLIKETGLAIHPPSATRDTFLAHVGGKYALEKDRFDDYHRRIFEAVWKHDEDIGQQAVLVDIAHEVGLVTNEFKAALNAEKYKQQVADDYRLAAERKIWTIPSYIGPKGEIQVHHFKDLPTPSELEKIL